MKVIPTRNSGGLYHLVKDGISLREEQWHTISYAMQAMGRQKKYTKAEKFFAPIDVVGAANDAKEYRENDGQEVVKGSRYLVAFPQELRVYRDRFDNKDLGEHCETMQAAVIHFQCNQFQLRRDGLKGNTLRDGLHAFRDFVEQDSKFGTIETAAPVKKWPTESQFEAKLTNALSLCHAWISYNPFVLNRNTAFTDLMTFYDDYKRKSVSDANLKKLMMAQGMTTWCLRKLRHMKGGQYYVGNHFDPTGHNVFSREAEAMKAFRAILLFIDVDVAFEEQIQSKNPPLAFNPHTSQFLPTGAASQNTLQSMLQWYNDPTLPQEYYNEFDWLTTIRLSTEMRRSEAEAEAAARREESAKVIQKGCRFLVFKYRIRKSAARYRQLKRGQDVMVRLFSAKLAQFREKKSFEKRARTAYMTLVAQSIKRRKDAIELAKVEKELNQQQKGWFETWLPSDSKKASRHITVRQKQLKEAEECINARLKEDCRKTQRIECVNEEQKKSYKKHHKDNKLTRQPTTKLYGLVKGMVKGEAAILNSPEWDARINAWMEEDKETKKLEDEMRDDKTVGIPFQTVWDDEQPGVRSLYITKIPAPSDECTAALSECPQFPYTMPPARWIDLQIRVFQNLRGLIDDVNRLHLVKTPSYTSEASIMAGCEEMGIVTEEAFLVGNKLGMFRHEWDKNECVYFLKQWMPFAMMPTFHVYLEAFFELATNPEGRKFLLLHLIRYGTYHGVSTDDYDKNTEIKNQVRALANNRQDKTAEILANAARHLFEDYADVMLLKTCPIKRHKVPDISDETKAKTLQELEQESEAIVAALPKTYFDFRHQHPLNLKDHWTFDADKWLEEKEMGALGYFHPTQNLKTRGPEGEKKLAELNKAWEESNLEACLNDPEQLKIHEEICDAVKQRERPTAAVLEPRKRQLLDGTPEGQKRARLGVGVVTPPE